jgi:hypothetical protein
MSDDKPNLTAAQKKALAALRDDQFLFIRDQTGNVLVKHGLAVSELALKSVTYNGGTRLSNFHIAFKRTPKGKTLAEATDE